MTNEPATLPPENELHALLPWYATGRLNAADQARVEAALAADPALARSLERVEEELADTIVLNESLGVPSNRVRDDLFARIEAEGRRPRLAAGGWLDRIGAALGALTPRTLAWSAAAAALVIVLQSGMLATSMLTEEATYQTASGPGQPAVAEGAFALVVFAPEATAEQIARVLLDARASIVGGPFPGGMFRVRLAEQKLAAAEYGKALDALRAQGSVVRMAAPAN